MAVSKAQKAATAKYEAKVYDKVLVRLPRGKKSEIEEHIKPKGESLNGFISTAIDEKLERDKEKAGEQHPRFSLCRGHKKVATKVATYKRKVATLGRNKRQKFTERVFENPLISTVSRRKDATRYNREKQPKNNW